MIVSIPLWFLTIGCVDLGLVSGGGDNASTDVGRPVDTGGGGAIFTTIQNTVRGDSVACATCHAEDGSGDIGPDIRGENAGHLLEHAQGEGRHPEGVKFPDLSVADFDAIAIFLGGEPGAGDEDDEDEDDANVDPGDAAIGSEIFTAERVAIGGAVIACAACHGADGGSGFAPDIRGEPGSHLEEHAQGEGRHPDGIKFPQLTAQDFADIAAFLAGSAVPAP